jgi:hypothetical protein
MAAVADPALRYIFHLKYDSGQLKKASSAETKYFIILLPAGVNTPVSIGSNSMSDLLNTALAELTCWGISMELGIAFWKLVALMTKREINK